MTTEPSKEKDEPQEEPEKEKAVERQGESEIAKKPEKRSVIHTSLLLQAAGLRRRTKGRFV